MFKKAFLTFIAIFVAITEASAINLNAESYYFIEPTTGTVILEKNADKQMGPASLSKMMTAYLLFEALDRGDITLETLMPISEKAWRKGGSKMFLEVGKKVKVDDLIQGILVSSGNDACIVAAEFLGGTEDAFAGLMNERALSLGMLNTTFKNASGWPHPEQVSTAKDMAILAQNIVEKFPQYYDYFSIQRFSYNDISQPNRNGLLRRNAGVDGMKTGHIDDAGYHLVSSAKRGDIRLVSAIMGASGMRAREDETLTGLSHAFRTNSMIEVVKKDKIIEESAPVFMGEVETVPLKAGSSLNFYVSNRDKKNIQAEVVYEKPLKAPIELGQKVGTLIITHPTTDEKIELPLLAAKAVGEAGIISKFWGYILHGIGF